MAALTVPAKSLLPSVHNFSSLQWKEVIQPKCMSPSQDYGEKSKISVQEIKRNGVSSPNNCSISQKKTEVNEFDDQTKKLVSSCDQEDKKKIRSKFIIKLPPKNKEIAAEDELKDETKELVSSCNQEDKKKIRSLKFFIKLPPTEKKIAEEDEKKIANLVDEKPVARTRNSRPRRKTNSRYASSVSEETFESAKKRKREFTISLTKEEIEEDYFHLMGKPLRSIKTNKKKRVR